jgi:hypothetical protein
MLLDEVSPEVRDNPVVKNMMEKTRSNFTSPVRLEQVYLEACRRDQ